MSYQRNMAALRKCQAAYDAMTPPDDYGEEENEEVDDLEDDSIVCPTCIGTGSSWDFPCTTCEGTGRVEL